MKDLTCWAKCGLQRCLSSNLGSWNATDTFQREHGVSLSDLLRRCKDCLAWTAREKQVQFSLWAFAPKFFGRASWACCSGGSSLCTMMLKDALTSVLGCCTSILALLNSNFSAYLTHMVCLSHQHNPQYFSAVISGSQQWAGHQGVGTGMQACHDQGLHLQVIKQSPCSCTGLHLQTPLETFHLQKATLIKYGTSLAVLQNAWSIWLFCPNLHGLFGLRKKDGESTLVSDTSNSLVGCFQGYSLCSARVWGKALLITSPPDVQGIPCFAFAVNVLDTLCIPALPVQPDAAPPSCSSPAAHGLCWLCGCPLWTQVISAAV